MPWKLRVSGSGIRIAPDPDAMMIRLFDKAIDRLTNGLEYTSRRHEVLTKNVANLETPGYRALDVTFDDYLKPAGIAAGELATASLTSGAPGDPRARLVYAGDGLARDDGNDVSLDRQMARLAENTLFNHTLVQVLASRFASVKQAISGRV
jgi:flagellar basal-body rod protein FlgB